MARSDQRRRIVRSGAIGFVAGLATLGVVASASPLHGAVASAVGAEAAGWDQLLGGREHGALDAHASGSRALAQQSPSSQEQGQWLLPQDQSQQQPHVQPQPQQVPQSRAS